MDELGRPCILKFEYDGVVNHGWSLDVGRSPEYNEQTITESVGNCKLRFETHLDRQLYGTPLRPSNLYMASDMLAKAWIDNGERDCAPRQLAQNIGNREMVFKDGKRTPEFIPKYTFEGIKKKRATYAELNNWTPGCPTPNDIAYVCDTEGHPSRLRHAAKPVYSTRAPGWDKTSIMPTVCMNAGGEHGFVYNAEETKRSITLIKVQTLYEEPPARPVARKEEDKRIKFEDRYPYFTADEGEARILLKEMCKKNTQ